MIYGTKHLKNGNKKVCFEFTSGKTITLNPKDSLEFKVKLKEWCFYGVLKYCAKKGIAFDINEFNKLYDWEI